MPHVARKLPSDDPYKIRLSSRHDEKGRKLD